MSRTVEENKKLIEEMPFLLPHNRWTGEVPDDYDYTYTELDMAEVPQGWDDLVLDCCKELVPILVKGNYLDKFTVVQIKEKYGELRFYHGGLPKEIFDEVEGVINKYCEISRKTCARCGKPGKMTFCGWISPYCKECWDILSQGQTSYEEATRED